MSCKKTKFRKGDTVIVIRGSEKGKVGQVKKIFPRDSSVLVEGVNFKVHHNKPTPTQEGGRVKIESKLHASKVAFYDSQSNRPVKIGYKIAESGHKVRYNKTTGHTL